MSNKTTDLFNERTFYPAFIKDVLTAEKEVIIYSPFISRYRADFLRKTLLKLKRNNIRVFIFTRPIEEHEEYMQEEIRLVIKDYEALGAQVTYIMGSIHEKVAIIDRKVLWEGSMNILSQRSSKEIMRRIASEDTVRQIIFHLKLTEKLTIKSATGNQNLGILSLLIQVFISVIRWSLLIVYRVLVIVLKGVLVIFNILDAIFN